MPNGQQTEYEKWYAALPSWLRGIAKPPVKIAKVPEPPEKPWGIAQPTWTAGQIVKETDFPVPPDVTFAAPSPGERIAWEKKVKDEVEGIDLGMKVPPKPTEAPPEGFRWAFDRDVNRWVPEFVGLTPWQQAQLGEAEKERAGFPAPGQPPTDAFGRNATWNTRLGEWDYPPNFGQRPTDQPAPISPYQQQQFGLQEQRFGAEQQQFQQQFGLQQQQFAEQQQQFQQQLTFQQAQAQMAQEEQERQYLSQLAAQPINWLQYAAYTGEQPVVQPWMQPLGFQETEGALPQGVEVGQPIPGLQLSEGMFRDLPQLRTPSAQLQARWGPTAQQQFLGYRQARTGATPEETQFRLGSQRAPTGRFGGFSRFR